MADEPHLPLRADSDPQVLAAQLKQALQDLPSAGDKYQGYLAQVVRSCFLAIQDGDLESPQVSIDLLASVFHLGERLVGSVEAVEAAAWIRATSRFFEVAKEALAPRITVDTLLARERSDTELEVLQILQQAEKIPLRRGEIAARWNAVQAPPTTMRIGQILAGLHEVGLVVRVKQRARGGSDVAFYRLSRLGRQLCARLGLQDAVPKGVIDKDTFYDQLRQASRADTTEPLYLTTFDNLESHGSAKEFHEAFLANLSDIRRPVQWIFVASGYFQDSFRPGLEGASSPVKLYVREGAKKTIEPTIQVVGNGGYLYPFVEKTALVTGQDVGLEGWKRHQSAAHPLS
jgi:hypothetical protein